MTVPSSIEPGKLTGVRVVSRDYRGRKCEAALLVGARVGGETSWQCFMLREGSLRLEEISTVWLRELE